MILKKIEKSWGIVLQTEFKQDYFIELQKFLEESYTNCVIFPSVSFIFKAFEYCPFSLVKVILLGQDPYHKLGQAHGLSFSVPDGVALPPSLKNIYIALQQDLNIPIPLSGNLEKWASQGVLLLNSILTVEQNKPSSHKNKGWEYFTDYVIRVISENTKNSVFLLWGNYAKSKKKLIDSSKHLILEAPHPSPLSAYKGFLECKHFSQTNDYLYSKGLNPILW